MKVLCCATWQLLHLHLDSLSSKLDNNNFIVWHKQVLATPHGHKFQHFIFGTKSPPFKFLEPGDEASDKINLDFLDWERVGSIDFVMVAFLNVKRNYFSNGEL